MSKVQYKEGVGFFNERTSAPLPVTESDLRGYAHRIARAYRGSKKHLTVCIAVIQEGGTQFLVYTTNRNKTSKEIRAVADQLGIARWTYSPRAIGRGIVGAPGDAEQILFDAADGNSVKVMAVTPSNKACADCAIAIPRSGAIYVEPYAPRAQVVSVAVAGKSDQRNSSRTGAASTSPMTAATRPAGDPPARRQPTGAKASRSNPTSDDVPPTAAIRRAQRNLPKVPLAAIGRIKGAVNAVSRGALTASAALSAFAAIVGAIEVLTGPTVSPEEQQVIALEVSCQTTLDQTNELVNAFQSFDFQEDFFNFIEMSKDPLELFYLSNFFSAEQSDLETVSIQVHRIGLEANSRAASINRLIRFLSEALETRKGMLTLVLAAELLDAAKARLPAWLRVLDSFYGASINIWEVVLFREKLYRIRGSLTKSSELCKSTTIAIEALLPQLKDFARFSQEKVTPLLVDYKGPGWLVSPE